MGSILGKCIFFETVVTLGCMEERDEISPWLHTSLSPDRKVVVIVGDDPDDSSFHERPPGLLICISLEP
ncbi:hypothetical protein EJB05_27976, partial [Eragrostis curvula]